MYIVVYFKALCRITKHNPNVFQSVIDTVGVTTILSTLSFGITRIQQAIVTMFGMLISSGTFISRLIQDKVSYNYEYHIKTWHPIGILILLFLVF